MAGRRLGLFLKTYEMRIGILTLPLHTNYGGILQAYALQTALERMGQEVRFEQGIILFGI